MLLEQPLAIAASVRLRCSVLAALVWQLFVENAFDCFRNACIHQGSASCPPGGLIQRVLHDAVRELMKPFLPLSACAQDWDIVARMASGL